MAENINAIRKQALGLINKINRSNRINFIAKEGGIHPYRVTIGKGSGGYIVTRMNRPGGDISVHRTTKQGAIAHATIALEDGMTHEIKKNEGEEWEDIKRRL